jgi:putative ABC transport system permease protein
MKRLLVKRRARHDLPQLLTIVVLVIASTALGLIGPGLVLDTLDEGAREAVASAGSTADVVVSVTVGEPRPGARLTTVPSMIALAETIPGELPEGLASVYTSSTLTVLSAETSVRAVGDEPWSGDGVLSMQIAMLTDENSAALTLVDGRLPAERDIASIDPVEVVLSPEAAAAAGVKLGDEISLGAPPSETEEGEEPRPVPTVILVGLVQAADPADELWVDSAEIWTPRQRAATSAYQANTRVTVLASPDGVTAAGRFLDYPFNGFVRMTVNPERFTGPLVTTVVAEAAKLRSNGQLLAPDSVSSIGVQTAIPEALADYPLLARAALAQMSVMMSALIGIAAVVLVLLSRLLVTQRAAAIALERARGASVVTITARALLESAVVTAIGTAIGGLVALLSPARDLLPVIVIALVALLAAPVQTFAYARSLWTGQREPANRRDRQQRARRRRGQRIVIELGIVAIAAAALISLRGRGLLQNRSGGIDPLLALAPLLLAVAVTIIVVRLYPYPVRAIGAVAQSGRGALGLLGAVRARSAIAVLPLLALTLGAALAVSGALLVTTVRDGQEQASWQRVGADARVSAEVDDADVAALRETPGVDAVSATRAREGVGLDFGTTGTTLTVVAVDASYADVVDVLPGQPSTDSLRELADQPTTGDAISIVLDPATAGQLLSDDIAMYYGPKYLPLHVIGTTTVAPEGYVDGPFAYVDIDAVAAQMPDDYGANSVLIVGPGADAAVAGLPADSVLTRSDWIDERRGLALVAGVESTMVFTVVSVGLLAVVALVATVVSGARSRGRALSMLRTLGMNARFGWWLALAELAPLVIAAVLGGIAAGLAVVLVLAPSLGLDVLAGGITVPSPSLSPLVILGLAGAALLLLGLGTLADVLAHRRDRLSEVLRVGETV